MHTRASVLAVCLATFACLTLSAADAPPELTITSSNIQRRVQWVPFPAAVQYNILSSRYVDGDFANDTGGTISGNTFTKFNPAPTEFYRLGITQMSSNAILTANVLNRIAYGPTPDELERVASIGPQAYINEQLNIQGVAETLDDVVVVVTNGVNGGQGPPNTNWATITIDGRYSNPSLYIYMTTVGDFYLDAIELRPIFITNEITQVGQTLVTNAVRYLGANMVNNGSFESPLAGSWTVSTNMTNSVITSTVAAQGISSLHGISTFRGTTRESAIWQNTVAGPGVTNNHPVQLSYRYLPGPKSERLTLRLSGNGVVSSAGEAPPPLGWIYATATGTATGTPQLYIYLNNDGIAYIDDVKLVAGSVAGVGPNLVQNGGFEGSGISPWIATEDFTNSVIDNTVSHSGNGSLKIVATDNGGGNNDSIYQIVPTSNGSTYTVSYWYMPAQRGRTITVRMSGSILNSQPDNTAAGLTRRLNTIGGGTRDDLRAWFCRHAVEANRQLLETLSQFWENHFVTESSKSRDYLDRFYDDGNEFDRLSADWEYREMTKWRNAMLNPNCTFYDLLEISAESPAMIVYLDTVDSRGDGTRIANENYARELLELFCNGVDNGYEQTDIVAMSRAWTGWSVEIVNPEDIDNPFASQTVTRRPNIASGAISNLVGVWTFKYKEANHGTNRAPIFPGKTVPLRFGAPWAGDNYQLIIPRRTGTNSIQDGYDVIRHLANLPFTQEYISIKLCRLFIHDEFPNPTTRPELPEYSFYDYTNPNRTAEAELVRQCMLAWENSNPKGNIRAVLSVIFNSDLFRSHYASMQKIKTPFEYVASSVRALRSLNPNGSATANTDGYSFSAALGRMGTMGLFNRAEPNGFPEDGPPWISAGTVAERVRYIQAFLIASGGSGRSDAGNNVCDPVLLLKKKLSSGVWNNDGAVADYFLSILYPSEGKANLERYRAAAINFLNTDDAGAPSNPAFAGLSNTGGTYNNRVRGMVAMLMTFQRFHEQ